MSAKLDIEFTRRLWQERERQSFRRIQCRRSAGQSVGDSSVLLKRRNIGKSDDTKLMAARPVALSEHQDGILTQCTKQLAIKRENPHRTKMLSKEPQHGPGVTSLTELRRCHHGQPPIGV